MTSRPSGACGSSFFLVALTIDILMRSSLSDGPTSTSVVDFDECTMSFSLARFGWVRKPEGDHIPDHEVPQMGSQPGQVTIIPIEEVLRFFVGFIEVQYCLPVYRDV